MSYATGNKKQTYNKVKSEDEENLANPLLKNNQSRQVKLIETQMNAFKQKLKTLEDMHNKVGTSIDNPKFR